MQWLDKLHRDRIFATLFKCLNCFPVKHKKLFGINASTLIHIHGIYRKRMSEGE